MESLVGDVGTGRIDKKINQTTSRADASVRNTEWYNDCKMLQCSDQQNFDWVRLPAADMWEGADLDVVAKANMSVVSLGLGVHTTGGSSSNCLGSETKTRIYPLQTGRCCRYIGHWMQAGDSCTYGGSTGNPRNYCSNSSARWRGASVSYLLACKAESKRNNSSLTPVQRKLTPRH